MLTESVSTRIFVNSTLCALIFIHIVWNHVLVSLSSLNVSLSTVILFLCLTVCPTVCLLSPTCLLFSIYHVKSTSRRASYVRRARSCSLFLIRAFYLLSNQPTAHGVAFVPHCCHQILSSLASSHHDYHRLSSSSSSLTYSFLLLVAPLIFQ